MMFYMPLLDVRYFTPDWSSPEVGKERYLPKFGFVAGAHKPVSMQRLLEEGIMWGYTQLSGLIPMEDRIVHALEEYGERCTRDLEILTDINSMFKPNCTTRTALKRLEAQGRIQKRLIEQGWYRRYVYSLVTHDGGER